MGGNFNREKSSTYSDFCQALEALGVITSSVTKSTNSHRVKMWHPHKWIKENDNRGREFYREIKVLK